MWPVLRLLKQGDNATGAGPGTDTETTSVRQGGLQAGISNSECPPSTVTYFLILHSSGDAGALDVVRHGVIVHVKTESVGVQYSGQSVVYCSRAKLI